VSWLKQADKIDANVLIERFLQTFKHIKDLAGENTHSVQDGYSMIEEWADNDIVLAEEFLGKKEGSVFDAPDYERADMNVGDSGEFEEEHVLDKKKNYSVTPGPGSTVPGMPVNSPDIPTGIV
jgi:hypothetical protein